MKGKATLTFGPKAEAMMSDQLKSCLRSIIEMDPKTKEKLLKQYLEGVIGPASRREAGEP